MNESVRGQVPEPLDTSPAVLRDYALLADGRRGALVGPGGEVAWMCAPRWDSDAVLSALHGGRGAYRVAPTGPHVWGGHYEEPGLVWRNRWVTTGSEVECRDALAYPGEPGRVVLLRRVSVVAGSPAPVAVGLDVRAGFGRHPMRDLRRDDAGTWTARTGDLHLRWSGGARARVVDGHLVLDLHLLPGAHHDLVLEVGDVLPDAPVDASRAWGDTVAAWRAAVPDRGATAAPRDARHAYAVLRGLTQEGGGMVAAATLGLPERAEAGRNYDYRYVWLRDQAYAGLAAGAAEPLPLLDDAVAFTTARVHEHGADLAPAYRVDGSRLPDQQELGLPGYPGGRAIVGNHVNHQFQLDVLGEVLQLFACAARHDRLDADGLVAATAVVGAVRARWDVPDAGIWELHDAWWTQSRLACVAGLRSLAPVLDAAAGRSARDLAGTILTETDRRCLGTDGAWRRSPQHAGTDASLLLAPVRGATDADDPRAVATVRRVLAELADDHFAYRFRHDERPLGEAEGAFVLCGFTTAMALAQQGQEVAAARWFERNRTVVGPPGLLAEEFDVEQRQLRGNLPQGFVHAALLEAATRLGES
ncbi:glycoside hydrolase family 15 protein [Cellulosimicrobium terreum]|nr:glycoside hydrolase family 15 protein [Cellulosimicrobium terreum]